MQRALAMALVVVMALIWSAAGSAEEKKPDATLRFSEGAVAVGIGWSWGKGNLSYKGKEHAFKVKGLSLGEIGITKAEATGRVFNLKKLEDFDGLYAAASAEGTIALGAGETAMKNKKGVVIYVSPLTKGVNFKLAAEGVNFSLEKK